MGVDVVDGLRSTDYGFSDWHSEKQLKAVVSSLKAKSVLLAKPQTFMNNSGVAVSSLVNFYKITPGNLYVIHDDLDIKLGEYKIQFGKGPKDHGGLNSIYEKLGRRDFWHVRIGIENRIKNNELQIKGEDYVLQDFTNEEKRHIENINGQILRELLNKQ